MSELNDLITQLCPDGVPYKKLGDLCTIETGRLNANKAVDDGAYPFFTTAEKTSRINSYRWDTEALLIAGNANVGSVKHYTGKFEAYQRTYVLTNFNQDINVRFLFHFTRAFLKKYLANKSNSAAMTYIVLSTLKNFEIPVPPLPVQEEVVRILDSFTELEAELEAELADRKEQYEYYRDYLLDKNTLERMDGKPVAMMKLGDVILNLRTGLNPRKNFKLNTSDATNSYITVRELDGMDFKIDQKTNKVNDAALELILKRSALKQGDILFSGTGTIGHTALVKAAPINWGIKEGIYAITPNANMISPKFLIYLFHTTTCITWFGKKAMGGAVQSVSMADLKTLLIPVPSLATQERVVDILDRFDALTTSLTDGIPAEIAMRREQYEYYRSRLLDFPRLPDGSASVSAGE